MRSTACRRSTSARSFSSNGSRRNTDTSERHGAAQPNRFDPARAVRLDDPARFAYLPPLEIDCGTTDVARPVGPPSAHVDGRTRARERVEAHGLTFATPPSSHITTR
jgi:hypothetical protein